MLNKFLNYKYELILLCIGMILGISYYFIPVKYVILLACGIAGSILVLWKLEIGLYAVVFLLPFMPTMLIIGLILLIICSFIVRVITNDIKIKYGPLSIWIMIFGGLILLYSITSITPLSSLKTAAVTIAYLALYFVTINTVTSKKMLYTIIFTILCSATLESLYGIYQYKIGISTGHNNWTDPELFSEITTRVFGTLDNPNILSQYLELIIPLSFGLFWSVKNYLKKALFFVMFLIMVLCLFVTQSRGGWITFALSMIIFGILKDRRILLLGGFVGIISLNFLPISMMERLMSVTNLSESSNAYRMFLWSNSINIIKDFWYSGVGLGSEAFREIYTNFYIREGAFAYHVHNLYLQLLIEIGVFGFLSFIITVFMTFKHGLITLINSNDNLIKTIISSLIAGLTAFLFHGLTESSFYNFKIVFLFWFMISLIMSIREMNCDIKSTSSNTFSDNIIQKNT